MSFPFLRRSSAAFKKAPLIQPLITDILTRYCTHSGLHYLIYTIVCSSLFVFVCTCAAEIWLLPSWTHMDPGTNLIIVDTPTPKKYVFENLHIRKRKEAIKILVNNCVSNEPGLAG